MSAQQPVASSCGHRSTWIGSPAGSGPLPGIVPAAAPHRGHQDVRWAECAEGGAGRPQGAAYVLGQQLLTFHAQPSFRARLGAGQECGRSLHPGLSCSLGRPYAFQLGPALGPTAGQDDRVVHDQLHPIRPEPVGDADGELRRDDRATDGQVLHDARDDLPLSLGEAQSLPPEVPEPEVQVVEDLGLGDSGGDAGAFQVARENEAAPVLLHEQHRIDDRQWYLMPKSRRAFGVAVQEQSGHWLRNLIGPYEHHVQ